jgi:hypothetical protein
VIVELSEMASDTMLDGLAALMDGGSIEIGSADGKSLAVLKLASPAALVAGGVLDFNPIGEEDAALAQGQATRAHIRTAGGQLILECDVGDMASDAVIKLNTTQIYRDGPVRLRSFKLEML